METHAVSDAASIAPERSVRRSTYVGLFAVTLATLMYEIVLTRIFSVTMWYHFAFVAISVALFGMTVGALVVHQFGDRIRRGDSSRVLWRWSLAFALSIPPCFLTQLALPVSPHLNAVGIWSLVATCLVISVPFVLSGIVVALVLTGHSEGIGRLYAADLVGAAVGCIAVVATLQVLDGPSAVLVVAGFATLGALAFAHGAGVRVAGTVTALLAAVLVVLGVANAVAVRNGGGALRIIWAKEARDVPTLAERWNAFSRVSVYPGEDGRTPAGITIDTTAGTALIPNTEGQANTLRGAIQYLAHGVTPNGDVLVIGSGGGQDVRAGLVFDQRSVTGIEINPLVLRFANGKYGEFTGHLDRDPRVRFVNDEARSYLERDRTRYDIVQISLIDTWAAQGAGAFALTENSLYTTEAWELFLQRLQPHGMLSVTRFYSFPGTDGPLEMYRTAALAAQALVNLGVENPRDHVLIYRAPVNSFGVRLATILVSPDGFTTAQRAGLDRAVAERRFTPVLTPTVAEDAKFASLLAPGGPGPAVRSVVEDISPPTDSRPYFFQMANLRTFVRGGGLSDNFVTRPVLVLALLALCVLVLAVALLAVPWLLDRKHEDRRPAAPFVAYFAAIGFAFLLIEVSQLQRFSLYLGNPTSSLAVVLLSVLLFSGIGAMLTERFVHVDDPRSLVRPLAVLLVGTGAFGLLAPIVLHATRAATTPARVAIAVLLLAPLSLGMGMPFVIGMRAASAAGESSTAYLWAVNGAASVCASVLGVVLSVFLGIPAAFVAGFLCYAGALAAMIVITRGARRASLAPTS
ncbi:MAG: hypothetical protein ACKOZL_07585 [Actinomycetes bacterium]